VCLPIAFAAATINDGRKRPGPGMTKNLTIIAARAAPAVFVFFWCTGFIFSKAAQFDAEPLTTLALRMALTVPLLVAIALAGRARWPDWREAGHSALAGLLVHGFYLGGVFIAIAHHIPAGLAALIPGLQPVLTSTLANRFLGEKVSGLQWGGLALGLIGVLLVLHDRPMSGSASLIGWSASVISLLGITIGTLYQKRFCGDIDWRSGNAIQYFAAGMLFVLASMAIESGKVHWTLRYVFSVGYMAIVLSIGTIAILYWLIRNSAATQVASLFYLVPGGTALMAYALFGEKLDFVSIAGMAICAAGVFLVNWRGARP